MGAQEPDQKLSVGDTYPPFTTVLSTSDGTPLNLTGETVPTAQIRKPGVTDWTAAPAVVVVLDAAAGRVSYPWTAADTDTQGDVLLRFKGDIAGDTYTAPPKGAHLVLVSP